MTLSESFKKLKMLKMKIAKAKSERKREIARVESMWDECIEALEKELVDLRTALFERKK